MQTEPFSPTDPLKSLRLHWLGLFVVSTLMLIITAGLLNRVWEPIFSWYWLAVSAGVNIYLLWVFWNHLPENHPPDETRALFPDLGLPNLVTYWRGFLIACCAGFLLTPRPAGALLWVPALLFGFGILPDFIDGYLARITDRSTILGEKLDVAVDSISVLTGTLLIVIWGQVPVWFLIVGFARYLYLFGIWLRRKLGKPIYDLPPNLSRRALAGMQMGFIWVMLWPLFSPPATILAAYLFSAPFLINFIRDWFYVSGVLDTPLNENSRLIPGWATKWLPLAFRGTIVLGVGSYLMKWLANFTTQAEFFGALGVHAPFLFVALVILIDGLIIFSSLFGVIVRTTAILAVCIVGFHAQVGDGLSPIVIATAISSVCLFFLGSGTYTLWAPEEELLQRRPGESLI